MVAFCNNSVMSKIRSGLWAHSINLFDKEGNEINNYIIPDDVSSIGKEAFYGCSGLRSITISENVKSIGKDAFLYSGLQKVFVPVIDFAAFCNNTFISRIQSIQKPIILIDIDGKEIKDFIIPESVTSIGNSAFSGCSGLASIQIPNSVTEIGSDAFRGCTALQSIDIPNSVTSIGNYAFHKCASLDTVIIGNGIQYIGEGAFSNAGRLAEEGDVIIIT